MIFCPSTIDRAYSNMLWELDIEIASLEGVGWVLESGKDGTPACLVICIRLHGYQLHSFETINQMPGGGKHHTAPGRPGSNLNSGGFSTCLSQSDPRQHQHPSGST